MTMTNQRPINGRFHFTWQNCVEETLSDHIMHTNMTLWLLPASLFSLTVIVCTYYYCTVIVCMTLHCLMCVCRIVTKIIDWLIDWLTYIHTSVCGCGRWRQWFTDEPVRADADSWDSSSVAADGAGHWICHWFVVVLRCEHGVVSQTWPGSAVWQQLARPNKLCVTWCTVIERGSSDMFIV